MTRVVVGIDDRARDHATAEHLLPHVEQVLGGWAGPSYAGLDVASTHVVAGHVALAVSTTVDDDALQAGPATDRVAELRTGLADALPDAGVSVDLIDTGRTTAPVAAGPAELVTNAWEATRCQVARSSGRLVHFAGQELVTGQISVAEVEQRSCIDEVRALAGTTLGPDTVLDLGDFVRPTWQAGRCTLLVQQASWGLIPFEVREQIACCSDH